MRVPLPLAQKTAALPARAARCSSRPACAAARRCTKRLRLARVQCSFSFPEGADLDSARATLKEHLDVRGGRVRAGTTTFYDTFDGRLHGDGLTLRHRDATLT